MSNGIMGLDKVVFYSPLLARHLGVRAAILASLILSRQTDSPWGVRMTTQTLTTETGLTVNELRTARRKLREAGVLAEMRGERCMYYRIDELSLRAELDKVMS
ncbi:hypothetical protein [Cardiobacterium hominis]|uniref:hypothetical protein n=1 Tax=Cardiobacterium hominis TaxID=2718 RepID=UPI0028D8076E|nr:hypothetical protein [Cardiobacterium hominis]